MLVGWRGHACEPGEEPPREGRAQRDDPDAHGGGRDVRQPIGADRVDREGERYAQKAGRRHEQAGVAVGEARQAEHPDDDPPDVGGPHEDDARHDGGCACEGDAARAQGIAAGGGYADGPRQAARAQQARPFAGHRHDCEGIGDAHRRRHVARPVEDPVVGEVEGAVEHDEGGHREDPGEEDPRELDSAQFRLAGWLPGAGLVHLASVPSEEPFFGRSTAKIEI